MRHRHGHGRRQDEALIALLYRLLAAKRFRRVCFVVDRSTLGNGREGKLRQPGWLAPGLSSSEIFGLRALGDVTPRSSSSISARSRAWSDASSIKRKNAHVNVPFGNSGAPATWLAVSSALSTCNEEMDRVQSLGDDVEIAMREQIAIVLRENAQKFPNNDEIVGVKLGTSRPCTTKKVVQRLVQPASRRAPTPILHA